MSDTAVVPEIIAETYPFSSLRGGANVLIFPDLTSANTCYKLLARIGGAETIRPILMGMSKPVHVLQRGAEVEEIVNIAAIAVVDAQETEVRVNGGAGKKAGATVADEAKLQPVHNGDGDFPEEQQRDIQAGRISVCCEDKSGRF